MAFNNLYRSKFVSKKGQTFSQPKPARIRYTEEDIPIRCLYVSALPDSSTKQSLLQHFKRFGDIENVRVHCKPGYCFAFIIFERAEDAATALSNHYQKFGNRKIRVFPADSWHQPPVQSVFEHTTGEGDTAEISNTSTTIMDLNDDCLIELFKHLSIRDLCNVADTNQRFKQNAEIVFSASYKQFCTMLLLSPRKGCYEITLSDLRSVFKNFGHLITGLDISKNSFKSTLNNRILDLIIKYCNGTLKQLELESFAIKGLLIQKLQPVFECLEKLTLNNCEINKSIGSLLGNCKELKKLKICHRESILDMGFMEQNFAKLESISLVSIGMLRQSGLTAFLAKNPQIKKLKIKRCEGITDGVFKIVAEQLEHIEKLSVNLVDYSSSFTKSLEHIKNLENLKNLQLKCGNHSITSVISNLKSKNNLNHLQLSRADVDEELIDSICAMPNLSVLKLAALQNFTEGYLKQIGKIMVNLSELSLTDCKGVSNDAILKLVQQLKRLKSLGIHEVDVHADETFYNRLLAIVQTRLDKVKLTVFVDLVSIPQSLINKNSDILFIAEIDSDYYIDDSDEDDFGISDGDYSDSDSVDSDIYERFLGFRYNFGGSPYDSDNDMFNFFF